ncbi:DUF2865 domain-containing protein [Bradyrhizobium sp. Tv2a-2]|uniref:DUF2865 domain-containing protein n=1 Tax=Bradyrhizobium sp. Tv2a-2 TaxID=113395 RepID=UPI000464D2AA|nr:DUF2865 domain-containing protein [Bradyrhizobium sp. Tv2a-2]
MRSRTQIFLGLALAVSAACLPLTAQAGDFFSALFGAFGARPPAPLPRAFPPRVFFAPPFDRDDGRVEVPRRRASHGGGGQAWCVRSCDGRYFPIAGPDSNSRAESCSNFCPASPIALVYGSEIDSAVTEDGKPYSELPNAYRYRTALVAGCTCNGKDPAGLASIPVDNDPTLRKGDLVAGRKGLEVATRDASRGAANFTPLPQSARARYRNLPVVAAGR